MTLTIWTDYRTAERTADQWAGDTGITHLIRKATS